MEQTLYVLVFGCKEDIAGFYYMNFGIKNRKEVWAAEKI